MSEIIDKIVVGLQEALKNDYIVTFIISMIPTIEVRGAIPVALQMGIKPVVAYFFSCLSALIVIPILMLCLKPLLNALKKTKLFKNIASSLEDSFKGKAQKIENKAELKVEEKDKQSKKLILYKMLGLFAFVAIPLPMTGVWTGTIVALFLNMDMKNSLLPLIVGNFVAGAIIITASLLLGEKSYFILLILFVFILITIIGLLIGLYNKNKKAKAIKQAQNIVYTDKDNEESDSK